MSERLIVIAYVKQPLSREEAQRCKNWLIAEAEQPVMLRLQMAKDYGDSIITGSGLK